MADVPLQVISDNAVSERRITPSWTVGQLKAKLETVTGIPPSSQILSLQASAGAERIPIDAADDDDIRLSSFPLVPYAELHVSRPSILLICPIDETACRQGSGACHVEQTAP
ncbi:hypothetical protein CDD82_7220 [Ophiocordyceps australis]|uniref:Ubiquitin-like domain-containing protein n=1 Tax=Ophiocordyceps australis TaxID=1399860 RepID=A0A2C5YTE3_9HYPO|nr:hypothetical protein CDD82_7220 [Ophiocordyceps australis]